MARHDEISGTFDVVPGPGGVRAPYYIIQFTEDGKYRRGEETRSKLLRDAEKATDVFVFIHGLNTNWRKATKKFREFIDSYVAVHTAHWAAPQREYRPLLVGVFWPSTYLPVLDEPPPDMKFAPVADRLSEQDAARLGQLMSQQTVTAEGATEIAELLPAAIGADEPGSRQPTPAELTAAWRAMESEEQMGRAADEVKGFAHFWSPLTALRVLEIPTMKNRAGQVGSVGVSRLLGELHRRNPAARIHGIGHSYGCKALLSALCALEDDAVIVDSALLLQAAVSCYCFGECDGPDQYKRAPGRCRQPIVCTFTTHDAVLKWAYPVVVAAVTALGTPMFAPGDTADPPRPAAGRDSALGFCGPYGVDVTLGEPMDPPQPYSFPDGPGVVAINGSKIIGNHGDVTSKRTALMLLSQVMVSAQ